MMPLPSIRQWPAIGFGRVAEEITPAPVEATGRWPRSKCIKLGFMDSGCAKELAAKRAIKAESRVAMSRMQVAGERP